MRDDTGAKLLQARKMLLALVDSDEFYNLLPGNGADDYICERLREQIGKVFEMQDWVKWR